MRQRLQEVDGAWRAPGKARTINKPTLARFPAPFIRFLHADGRFGFGVAARFTQHWRRRSSRATRRH
jgi:hypothetical protein